MTDDEWACFETFLVNRNGRPPRNHRRVLDAVFWLMRTGAPWRDLPEEFGKWNSIFRQFRRWADSGIWDVMLEGLAGSGVSEATLQMLDATIVRAHHCAAGGKGGPSATRSVARVAASRTKINARTNAEGLPIGVVITPGQAHDVTAFPALMLEIDYDPQQMQIGRAHV